MNASRWMPLLNVLWFLLFAVGSSVYIVTASEQLSGTFDETAYVQAGLEAWRSGSYRWFMAKGTMPLPIDVQTLPLYLWELHRGEPFHPLRDYAQLLPIARLGNLVFWWLLLLYGWKLGRHLGNGHTARLSVAFLALEPNLLGHASLATTDIAITATTLALAYHFWVGRERGWLLRVGVPAVCYAAATLSKASGMVFGPMVMFMLETHRLWTAGRLQRNGLTLKAWLKQIGRAYAPLRWDGGWALALGMLLVFAYCGCDWQNEPSFIRWAESQPDEQPGKSALVWTAHHLKIFTNAGEGLVQQIKHNFRGHGAYLLGEWQPRAFWYYFPVALSMKLTIPALLMLAWLLLTQPRALLTPIGLVVILLFLFTFHCRVQIGIRLIFPLIAFLMIALALGTAQTWGRLTLVQLGRAGIILGLMIWSSLSVWPNALTFINRFWGGPEHGYRLLSDSNYDWGQGLIELRTWHQQQGEPTLRLWYFGSDPRCAQPPFHLVLLHMLPIRDEADLLPLVRGGYLAVSTSILYGNPRLGPGAPAVLQVLRQRAPIGRTSTFFIYDFTADTVAQQP